MSEMTNDEIKPKIARAKGWRVDNASITHDNPPALDFYVDAQGEQHGPVYAWNWPEDIAAAWGLVEDFPQHDCAFAIVSAPNDWSNDDPNWPKGATRFECKIYTADYVKDCPEEAVYVCADTAPRAICLAWLAWKGIE